MQRLCTSDKKHGSPSDPLPARHQAACEAYLEALGDAPRQVGGRLAADVAIASGHVVISCETSRVRRGVSCVAF